MPEEVGIALVVLFVAGWLLFKVAEALYGAFKSARDELSGTFARMSGAFARKGAQRFANRKSNIAQHVRIILPNELAKAERDLASLDAKLQKCRNETNWIPQRPSWEKKPFLPHSFSSQNAIWTEMNIAEIGTILRPDPVPWLEKESAIVGQNCAYIPQAPQVNFLEFHELSVPPVQLREATFEVDYAAATEKDISRFFQVERTQVDEYNKRRSAILLKYDDLKKQIETWNAEDHERWKHYIEISAAIVEDELSKFQSHAKRYTSECNGQKEKFRAILDGFQRGSREHVIARVEYILGSLALPSSIPRLWNADFDEDQHILIVEIGLPDVVHRSPVKTVLLKSGAAKKLLNQTERKEYIPQVHPAILLRIAFELFRNDSSETIKLLVLNGWVSFNNPNTGIDTKAYTASVMLERSQVASLNLRKIDPLAAFQSLNGKSAGRLVEIIPIEPTLNLKRTDSRFVDAKAVLNTLNSATNLAAMDWQDFEHLIRELFEREFSGRGAEVKITQASRDRGVDAIVFNPDPIHGGKYIIQAKRYSNTVDVSAVRDLCAVVRKEGASRGILVTTSTYGADAYAFADNEPVTLLNGAELLGLLSKHGYRFRINLQEARLVHSETSKR